MCNIYCILLGILSGLVIHSCSGRKWRLWSLSCCGCVGGRPVVAPMCFLCPSRQPCGPFDSCTLYRWRQNGRYLQWLIVLTLGSVQSLPHFQLSTLRTDASVVTEGCVFVPWVLGIHYAETPPGWRTGGRLSYQRRRKKEESSCLKLERR